VPHEPVPYHRLLRTLRGYRWWKPLLAILVAAAYYLVLSVVLSLVLFAIGVATGDIRTGNVSEVLADLNALQQLDAASPFSITFALTNIAIMLPAVQLAMLTVGLRPTGVRHSVAFRLRWGWMLLALGPAAAVFALNIGIGLLIGGLLGGEWPEAPTTALGTFVLCAVVIVVLTPFQAAAEEYVFRGLFAQALGGWIRYLPFAVVIPSLAFAALHAYDPWGLVDVFLFGVAAGLVVWRTGGLEASISMHAVNNVGAFLMLTSGIYGTTINQRETSGPVGPAISLVTLSLWVLWMSWLARRRGVARTGTYAPPAPPVAIDAAGVPVLAGVADVQNSAIPQADRQSDP
jgi:membrane protease YdiL (CAAX protease family)